jgi:hypothetical protein
VTAWRWVGPQQGGDTWRCGTPWQWDVVGVVEALARRCRVGGTGGTEDRGQGGLEVQSRWHAGGSGKEDRTEGERGSRMLDLRVGGSNQDGSREQRDRIDVINSNHTHKNAEAEHRRTSAHKSEFGMGHSCFF